MNSGARAILRAGTSPAFREFNIIYVARPIRPHRGPVRCCDRGRLQIGSVICGAARHAADAGDAGGGPCRAGRGCHGVRRDAEVAAVDDRPAAGRRTNHADSCRVRPAREPGRAAGANRRAPAAGGRVEPGGRAGGARGGRDLRAPAGAARKRTARRRRDQQTGTGTGGDGAADGGSESSGAAGAGPAAARAAPLLHRRSAASSRCKPC